MDERDKNLDPLSYDGFYAWLSQQPKSVTGLLTARSAMRALPEVYRGIGPVDDSAVDHIEGYGAAVFRACATALCVALHPSENSSRDLALAHNYSFFADGRYTAIRAARAALNVLGAETDEEARKRAYNEINRDWYAVALDAKFLVDGGAISQLAARKLWGNRTVPTYIHKYWHDLIAVLPKNHNWEVWIEWYESYLEGKKRSESYEAVFSSAPASLWGEGARQANTWIRQQLTSMPAIPAGRPATVEPILIGEIVTISRAPINADLSASDIAAALTALKSRFERLLGEIEQANIDPRFPAILRDFIDRLPSSGPDAATVLDMGHELAALRGYEPIVIEEWPSALSPRYSAALLALDLTLKKFPKWKEFAAEQGPSVTPEQAETTVILSHVVADDLRAPGIAEHVDPVVPQTLDALAERSKEIGGGIAQMHQPAQAEAARDQLESVNNLLKLAASIALAANNLGNLASSALKHLGAPAKALAGTVKTGAKYASDKMWEGAKEPLDNFFKESGKKLASSAVAFLKLMTPFAAGWLMAEFPTMFSWLKPILQQLGWL